MEIITQLEQLERMPRAVTFGKFDGVHAGHQALIKKIALKWSEGLVPTVMTFDRQPQSFLNKNFNKPVEAAILTRDEKFGLLKALGVKCVFEYPVTKESMSMPAEKFVTDIIMEKLNARYIAAGIDFCFGCGRKGDVKMLAEMAGHCGYEFEIMMKEEMEGKDVSSSRIKKCLTDGDIKTVNRLLGYPYAFSGEITKERRDDRTCSSSITLCWPKEKLSPAAAAYTSGVLVDGRYYPGVANTGKKMEINGSFIQCAEVYINNCNISLIGKKAIVQLIDTCK